MLQKLYSLLCLICKILSLNPVSSKNPKFHEDLWLLCWAGRCIWANNRIKLFSESQLGDWVYIEKRKKKERKEASLDSRGILGFLFHI